ncbi:MAG: hypothetical protein JXN60_00510 [Lentisphaerae bacterium]|nr:hypothetical protein [Lentisphaerota bacterium]
MTEEKEEISPEEKLLKVIQGKPEPEKEQKVGSADVAPSALKEGEGSLPVVESVQAEGEKSAQTAAATKKPKLRLTKTDSAVGADSKALEEPVSTAGLIGGSNPVLAVSKRGIGVKFGISSVNRFLAAGIVIALAITGLEIWGFLRNSAEAAQIEAVTEPMPFEADVSRSAQYSFPEVLIWYEQHPILLDFKAEPQARSDDSEPRKSQGPRVGWEAYVRSNMKLMGVSRHPEDEQATEAILADNKTKAMHFMKTDDSIFVSNQKVSLKRIDGALVVLTDGRNDVTIE